ncbi:MAG: tetratricopeptide repeat protein [Bacteroidetes bacterium]|nr:tetratricopeptide repeat protein [Bacteroidota bacterium]
MAGSALARNPAVNSKQEEIDSLLKVLPNAGLEQRVDVLFSLSRIYLSISMDSSREYARLALISSKELKDNKKIGEAYKLLGNISMYKGNLNNVISFYDSSLAQYSLARDSFGLAKVWNNLGIIYHNLGDYQKSIDYHLKSLECKLQMNDSVGIANSYNNIGSIYLDLKEYVKSYEYFQNALKISRELNQQTNVAGILNNLGMINQEVGDQEKAIDYFNQSLDVGLRVNNYKGMADSYHNLGKSYFLLGNYSEALNYYNRAIETYETLGIDNSNTYNNIAQVYIELGDYTHALSYLNEALRFADKNNQIRILRDIYRNFSVAYEKLGWYKHAHQSYILYNQYDDSLQIMLHSSKIEEILTKNEIEKQQEQIAKTKLELEKKESELRRRNLAIYSIIAGLIGTLIFAAIIFRLFRQKAKANKLLQEQNDEILRSQEIIQKINKALTENEGKLRSIFDISPYSIFVVNDKMNIVDCNETSLKMFHTKSKHDLLEKKLESFIVNNSDNKNTSKFIKQIQEGKLTKDEYKLRTIDGEEFSVEITGREIAVNSDKPNLYVVVITDITERLQFIENLKEAKIKAEESDKLKTAFLANMSHEIRTPMNSIVGFSNLLNDRELGVAKREEYLSHIMQSSHLLLNLIEDIIDISKIEAGQLNFNIQTFKLNDVTRDIFTSFKETHTHKNLEFKLTLPPNSEQVTCKTDPLRFKQVISNLLSNAIKFTEKGFVELGYSIKESHRKPTLEFFVKDSGIGIPKDKHELIFERFRQVDDSRTRTYGGTGLGLSISKRLIELIGGTIWVESKPEKGSIFYFTMPYIKGDELELIEDDKDEPHYDWKNKTLLIAEDENSNFELVKATLQKTKINIVHMINGEEAVNYIKKKNPVDVVLMDIRMPKMNGYDATRMIKSINPKLPVISVTAYAMSEDEAKSLQAGCDLYMSKPIRPKRLLSVLDDFLSAN